MGNWGLDWRNPKPMMKLEKKHVIIGAKIDQIKFKKIKILMVN